MMRRDTRAGSIKPKPKVNDADRRDAISLNLPSTGGGMMEPAAIDVDISSAMAPIPSQQQKPGGILAITDKIAKALHEFENMYDANHEEDQLLGDITDQVNMMEGGQLKVQLKSFINKYKELTTDTDDARNERDDILESLADWFTSDHLGMDMTLSINEDEIDSQTKEIQEEMLNTKMGFDKLKMLNEQIANSARLGQSTKHLERERKLIQENVVLKFKHMKNEVKKKKVAQNDQVAWKYAADEIFGLLKKVREAGGDTVADLRKQLETILPKVEEQAKAAVRMKAKLKESQKMEKKWKEDNLRLTEELAMQDDTITKLKNSLKESRAARLNTQGGQGSLSMDSEALAPAVIVEDKRMGNDPTILRAQLRDSKNQVEAKEQEIEKLKEQLAEMENELDDKEDSIFKLQNDKSELMRQMKQASVKPDNRRLSDVTNAQSTSTFRQSPAFGGSVTGIAIKSSHTCNYCHCHKKVTSRQSLHDAVVERKASVSVTITASENTQNINSHNPQDRETISRLTNQLLEQNNIITQLQKQLTHTFNEMTKQGGQITSVPYPTPLSTAEAASREPTPAIQAKQDTDAQSTVNTLSVHGDQDVRASSPTPGKPASDTHAAPADAKKESEPKVRIETRTVYVNMGTNRSGQQVECDTKSIQTDPGMDPYGAWSQKASNAIGWRPPVPPANWMNFDPTVSSAQTYQRRTCKSVADAMMKGVEPSEIRDQTENVASFIRREMDRVVQGIEGFVDYAADLAEIETKTMAQANTELTDNLQLSSRENHAIQEALESGITRTSEDARGFKKGFPPNQETEMTPGKSMVTQVRAAGDRAKRSLCSIVDVVMNNLDKQHRKYEMIVTTVQSRNIPGVSRDTASRPSRLSSFGRAKMPDTPGSGFQTAGQLPAQTPLSPVIKRSQSDHAMHDKASKEQLSEESKESGAVLYRTRSGSAGPMLERSTFSKAMMIDKGQEARNEVKVATAGFTKKGMMVLTTGDPDKSLLQDDQMQRVRRRTKPMPMSHKKLVNKQKELVNSEKVLTSKRLATKTARGGGHEQKPWYELPTEFFSTYTVADITEKAEVFVEQSANEHKHNFIGVIGPTVNPDTLITGGSKDSEAANNQANVPVLPPIGESFTKDREKLPPI